MLGDSKPRQFTYLAHKDDVPLQLKGTMKKKCPLNYSRYSRTNNFEANHDQRQKIAQKISYNYQDLKSIVPSDLAIQNKPHKIKTYPKQRYLGIAGVPYLIVKSNNGPNHSERKHLKHNQSDIPERSRKQEGKKHYCKDHIETYQQIEQQKPHTQSLKQRIFYDLHSSYNRRERQFSQSIKRNPQRNLFKEGIELGLERKIQRPVSAAKKNELAGSYYRPEQKYEAVKRDDWRRSSFTLG